MQATVFRIDASGSGSVILDDGLVLPFGADAVPGAGLRHLRVGQRLTVLTDPDGRTVTGLALGTIAGPAPG